MPVVWIPNDFGQIDDAVMHCVWLARDPSARRRSEYPCSNSRYTGKGGSNNVRPGVIWHRWMLAKCTFR